MFGEHAQFVMLACSRAQAMSEPGAIHAMACMGGPGRAGNRNGEYLNLWRYVFVDTYVVDCVVLSGANPGGVGIPGMSTPPTGAPLLSPCSLPLFNSKVSSEVGVG